MRFGVWLLVGLTSVSSTRLVTSGGGGRGAGGCGGKGVVGHHHVAAVLLKFPEEEMGGLQGLMMRTRSL